MINGAPSNDPWLDQGFVPLWQDEERLLYRGAVSHSDGSLVPVIAVVPGPKSHQTESIDRLNHELRLADRLAHDWAVLPLSYSREEGVLYLSDPGGDLLAPVTGPSPIVKFLHVAIGLAAAITKMHGSGVVHKDIKPSNVFFVADSAAVRLTGFGIASLATAGLVASTTPDVIAGTFAYMSPEQTGRMGRHIDARSDLYSLGVVLYELLTGSLPFHATDSLEWIHCHLARQPVSPDVRLPGVPAVLSAIVIKLLNKAAEMRYQSAAGLHADLVESLHQWEIHEHIAEFPLGLRDGVAELRFRDRLYGREREAEVLTAALQRVGDTGVREVVLVSGYSGVGKSCLVNELRKQLVPTGGLFAAGKFDQYKKGIPHAPLALAFGSLVGDLLGKSEDDLLQWRSRLLAALGIHGQLIVNMVPELEGLIGEQPRIPELSGPEARGRFLAVVRRFLSAFAGPDHPVVVFVDDLQWLDEATLDVFVSLAIHPEVSHLLLLGAYRANEADAAHPLHRGLEAIRQSSARMSELELSGIQRTDVRQMLAEALREEVSDVSDLADCVFDKTGGNPLFSTQFVAALADSGILRYEPEQARWRWSLQRAMDQMASANIVDLMVDRLRRLPADASTTLCTMACMGNRVDQVILSQVLGDTVAGLKGRLQEALKSSLVKELEGGYSFAHDRVHEASYAMLSEVERSGLHLRIGELLFGSIDDAALDSQVFDIVSHFNRAAVLITSPAQRATLGSLNLRAGRRARASAAYAAACEYLAMGRARAGDAIGADGSALGFELALEHAECTFLRGDVARTGAMVEHLLASATRPVEIAASYRLKVELHVVSGEYEEAVNSGLIALHQLGIDIAAHPTQGDVNREYAKVWAKLDGRSMELIADLPPMEDAAKLAAMRLLAELWPPTYFTEFKQLVMVVCNMVNLSLEYGSAHASNQGFALFGWLLGPVFGRYADGQRWCSLACELAAKQNAPLDYGRTCLTMGLTASWVQPLSVAIDWLNLAQRRGVEAGDLYFSSYCGVQVAGLLLMRGHNLAEEGNVCREHLAFTNEIGFQDTAALTTTVERTIECLRGRTRGLTDFSDGSFDGAAFEASVNVSRMSVLIQWYWTKKVMLHVLAGEPRLALLASARVSTGPWTRVVQVQYLDYHYFTALAITAVLSKAEPQEWTSLRAILAQHHGVILQWAAGTGSPTFADKPLLIEAEIARLEGRLLDAEWLYEECAGVARRNGFKQSEALAHELAGRFYRDRGMERVARAYLEAAVESYESWGAQGKVNQLVAAYPDLRRPRREEMAIGTMVAPLQQLDLARVLKVSKAVSSDVVADDLIGTLMSTAVQHAGAERGYLFMLNGSETELVAIAATTGASVEMELRPEVLSLQDKPESVLRFVMQARSSMIVDDALVDARSAADPYVLRRGARSMLCLPIGRATNLQGLLYLENNLASGVFTPAHLEVLELLASLATISLENARLYADLVAREAKTRRIFDMNVIGIVFWDLSGLLLDANDAFLRMVGHSREDLERGTLRWFDMTPPEWHAQVVREVQELSETGALQPIEKEYFRKDGSRVPVLLGAATFEGQTVQQGVAIIVDLSKQKEAEARAMESERRNRTLHADLAHASRIVTMGHLAAWIAHDVKQPLTGIVTSADAGLRWLAADPPNVKAAVRALERIVRDGNDGAGILDRTRALFKKTEIKQDRIDVNQIISETLAVAKAQAERMGVLVRTDLATSGVFASADRIQIQQVILNLVVNALDAMSGADGDRPELVITSTTNEERRVRVDVQDCGPGLPLDRIDRLFEAFYTTKADGLGMGLAICKSIVESFGGRIWGKPHLPRGAIFSFELPADKSVITT